MGKGLQRAFKAARAARKKEAPSESPTSGQNERKKLSLQEAEAMLPEGSTVHTFRNSSFMLIGADWKRSQLITAIKKHGVELAGPSATAMNHGLVLFDEHGALFVETRKGNSVH